MRKLFSLLLVVAMVLGLVSTAMAAAPTDVAGTTFETAVNRLAALGILGGYPDGTFKPNNNITRAETAKIMVNALGLATAADAAKGATKFKDVPATHWASGYINLAVSRGLITGYPDGTFKPEANVTNAEAIAMLVRVLGYQPAVVGEWPMNYISKGAEIGISKNLSLVPELAAIRGNVALMTNSSLTIDMMAQEYFGQLTSYKVQTGVTLLNTRFGVTEYKKSIVMATPSYARNALKANEVRIQLGVKGEDGLYPTNTYTFSGLDVESLLGHQVTVWTKGDELFNIVDTTPADRIVSFNASNTASYVDATQVTNTMGTSDATDDVVYTWATEKVAFYNHASLNTFDPKYIQGSALTLILNDEGKVRFVTALRYDPSVVVTKVVATGSAPYIEYYAGTNPGTKTKLSLAGAVYSIVDTNGTVKPLADISAGDILTDAVAGTQHYLRVTRSTVEGTVTKVANTSTTYSDYRSLKVYIGDTGYSMATGFDFTNADRTLWASSSVAVELDSDGRTGSALSAADDIRGLVGYTGTFVLDAAGKIRLVKAEAPVAPSNTGFVVKAPWTGVTADGASDFVKILKTDGTYATIAIDPDADNTNLLVAPEKEVVAFTMGAAGHAGDISFNGVNVTLAGTEDGTAVATKVGDASFPGWNVTHAGAVVTFTATGYGPKATPVFDDVDTTDVTATDVTTNEGVLNFVKLTLNDSGAIIDVATKTGGLTYDATINADYSRITVNNKAYVISSSTKLFDLVTGDPATMTWDELKNSAGLNVTLFPDADYPSRAAYVLVNAATTVGSATTHGVALVEKYRDAKGVYHVGVLADGTLVDYKLEMGDLTEYNAWKYGQIRVLTFDASGNVKTINKTTYVMARIEAGLVDQVGMSIDFAGKTYFTTEDTVVYDYRDELVKADFAALEDGQLIDMYLDSNGDIAYVVIQDNAATYTEVSGNVTACTTANIAGKTNGKVTINAVEYTYSYSLPFASVLTEGPTTLTPGTVAGDVEHNFNGHDLTLILDADGAVVYIVVQ